MSDEMILEDGRQWYAANWVVGSVLNGISRELSEIGADPIFCEWLHDRSSRCGGCIGFDVRGISQQHRELFYAGARRAFIRLINEGPNNWKDPSYYPSYVKKFEQLLTMKEHIDRGELPESLNDFPEAIEFDGQLMDLTDRWN